MYVPDHDFVDRPIPIPETREEARVLLLMIRFGSAPEVPDNPAPVRLKAPQEEFTTGPGKAVKDKPSSSHRATVPNKPMLNDKEASPRDEGPEVSLLQVVGAVRNELEKRIASLKALQARLQHRGPLEGSTSAGSNKATEEPIEERSLSPTAHARKVAADLETYATALRNLSEQEALGS